MLKRRGYSLVEVLTASAIFVLVIMLVFGAFQLSLKLTQQSREVSIATNLAEEKLDEMRSKLFTDIVIDTAPAPVSTTKLPNGFTKTYVSLYEGNDKIKEVRVAVYWANRPESRAVSLTTLIAQGGITTNIQNETASTNPN